MLFQSYFFYMDNYSFLTNSDPEIIESKYQDFKKDPDSVDEGWRNFFRGFDFALKNYNSDTKDGVISDREFKVINLINDYRKRGHLFTKTNPVRERRNYLPTLDIENFGLSKGDMETFFEAGAEVGLGRAKLSDIVTMLNETYCKSIGVEYVYIKNYEVVNWLRDKMEKDRNTPRFNDPEKKKILNQLIRAVSFEKFMHLRFAGQKRFSLQGGESLVPALESMVDSAGSLGVREFVFGMAHRGRLNVLANVMRKPYSDIFSEFEGKEYEDETLLGDVKYHLGYTSKREISENNDVLLTLSPNPSHLEAVNPIVEGITRAKIDTDHDRDFRKVVPVLIHGDASIAGQGVVYEVVQMAGLDGYKTGGTIHIVINNQIGFTTDYLDGRTSTYCTDVAKVTHSPVFHVNGDDPEAMVYAIQLAMEFRQKFQRDVFIDLLCYRKYGHNEGDEPRFTQPTLYKIIEMHPDPAEIYAAKLIGESLIANGDVKEMESENFNALDKCLAGSKLKTKAHITNFLQDKWAHVRKAASGDFDKSPDTAISKEKLLYLAEKLTILPSDLKFFRKTIKMHESRSDSVVGQKRVDWAMAELMAYGSLLQEGYPVRLSGQDSQRGTFSHRHAVLSIDDSKDKYIPLENLGKGQARFEVYNSPLSEYGVLGFDYGYALAAPDSLVVWEAQFGDFFNGAQIIFDQFLSSAEDKWNVMNDLVVLLPHGYEGQGPEHSSGRIERFLNLCAENNFQVANCTTPANFFHLLRRQLMRSFRKPLVVFTPKSLLRHPRCVSTIDEFSNGGFQELIDDKKVKAELVEKVVFCSGKVYYDLLAGQESHQDESVALVRLEQLFPLPEKQMDDILNKYSNAKTFLWVQEEPLNMGAWNFIHTNFKQKDLKVISRPASGSPATGSPKFHTLQQKKIVDKTFEKCQCTMLGKPCGMACIGNKWRSFEKELLDLHVETVESTFHSAERKL